MATMLDGESYLGRVLIRNLSQSGDVKLYFWPLRCLKGKFGGPTFGVDVKGEEIIRFDPHGPRGHWHRNGYDKLGAGGSHVEFPENLREDLDGQVAWSLDQIKSQTKELLSEAGHADAANGVDDEMLAKALDDLKAHMAQEGDHRKEAIAQGLINA